MKRLFTALFFAVASFGAEAEMRYVEIDSVSNAAVVRLKKLEDLEFLIGKNNVSVAFFQSSSGDLLINANGTYFSFPLNGYWTIDDYKKGESAGFKNGSDFSDAEFHCIESSELYYFFKSNSFLSVSDCTDAKKNGFPSSRQYYSAKEKGFSKYTDYDEYLKYNRLGYKTKDDWKKAEKKGFAYASSFYDAQSKGFDTNSDYQKAKSYNLQDESSFKKFCEIEDSIERIVSAKAADKRQAFVFHFLARLPKGESALSVLSKSLKNLYDSTPPDVKSALSMYVNNTDSSKNRDRYYGYNSYGSLDSLFEQDSLRRFFAYVETSELGTYSSQTEIFKRNGSKVNFPAVKKDGREDNENGTVKVKQKEAVLKKAMADGKRLGGQAADASSDAK